MATTADPFGSWIASSSTTRAKNVFVDFSRGANAGESSADASSRTTVPWHPATHGPADELERDRGARGGVRPKRQNLGRDQGGETPAKNSETEETRASPLLGTYRVVEALDFLRKATPATVLASPRTDGARAVVAAASTRDGSRRRRRSAAATMDADDDARNVDEMNEGPAWLTHEAARAADAATRPGAPAWAFLPLEVTRARDAAGRDVAPGDRPALDVKVTLARRREDAGAAPFGTATRGLSPNDANRTRTRVGPGAYDAEDAADAVAPRAPAADFGRAARFGGERDGENKRDGEDSNSRADFDPAGAYARMVAPRVPRGAAVDIRRGTNPRADDAAAARRVVVEGREAADEKAAAAKRSRSHRTSSKRRPPLDLVSGSAAWGALVDRSVDHETHAADARTSRAAAEARKSRALAKLDALVGGDALPIRIRTSRRDDARRGGHRVHDVARVRERGGESGDGAPRG